MSAIATKINVEALLSSKTPTGQSVEEILTELKYPTENLKTMYSFQQVLELDTIKDLKEETLEVLDTMVKDSLNLSKK